MQYFNFVYDDEVWGWLPVASDFFVKCVNENSHRSNNRDGDDAVL